MIEKKETGKILKIEINGEDKSSSKEELKKVVEKKEKKGAEDQKMLIKRKDCKRSSKRMDAFHLALTKLASIICPYLIYHKIISGICKRSIKRTQRDVPM